MSHYSATDNYCCLAQDKVRISQGLQYDLSLKQFVGNVSTDHSGASEPEKKHIVPATHVLSYMAKEITTKFDMSLT